jgi:hypothetical protein
LARKHNIKTTTTTTKMFEFDSVQACCQRFGLDPALESSYDTCNQYFIRDVLVLLLIIAISLVTVRFIWGCIFGFPEDTPPKPKSTSQRSSPPPPPTVINLTIHSSTTTTSDVPGAVAVPVVEMEKV